MLMEHRAISLADQVFERLESEILLGVYQKGEILTESKLVSDLGVSRTPVREALRMLEQEHVIETTGKGFLVLGVTQEDLLDIMEIRMRIEGLAAARTAQNISDEELVLLRETLGLQEYYVQKKDADHIKSFDSQFHQMLYKFCGSTVLYHTLMPLHKRVQKYRKASVQNHSRAERSLEEHKAILAAIEARDAKLAEKAALTHIENAKNHIINGD